MSNTHLMPEEATEKAKTKPESALTWKEATKKGEEVLELLSRTENGPQSPFTEFSQLEEWGWKPGNLDCGYGDAFEAVFRDYSLDPKKFQDVHIVHSEKFTAGGEIQPESEGFYLFATNPDEGALIADNSMNPTSYRGYKFADGLFPLYKWSDVVFLGWQDKAGSRIKNLKYIFRALITTVNTNNIIEEAYALLDNKNEPVSINTTQGKALLGTRHGKGIAYLLADHRAQLGNKTIKSVQIIKHDDLKTTYSLVFTLMDVPEVLAG